jgi:putative heme iron utilization protein
MHRSFVTLKAKTLVRQQHSGVLSTHSVTEQGYPFGSIVPYFMTSAGNLIIYISAIAQHTHNIKGNAKVSMTIFNALEDDSQAAARVTVLGDAQLVSSELLMAQYVALFPQAKGYRQSHDFHLYEITTKRVRFIGGFDQIFWLEQQDWLVAAGTWQQHRQGIIAHMNEAHQEAMALILQHQFSLKPSPVSMLSAFPEGVHLRADGSNYYLPFSEVCTTAQQVRQQLVAATHAARAALQTEPA